MVNQILEKQKKYFQTGVTKTYEFRIEQLKKLQKMIQSYEKEILEALHKDLKKHAFEAYTNEVGFTLDSIAYNIKSLRRWMKAKKVKSPLHQFKSKAIIESEPYGSVLIIGPFNYPFQLLIEPMIGALAAGNTIVLKPSEYTSHTEQLIVKMFQENFDEKYIHVFTGGVDITTQLINSPFDYIFFTGSVGVGKIVMKAAAENLVPVTLELGGKSPTIVDKTANLDIAARRIAWGKFINAGQTCIAPDYVYVHSDVEEAFKAKLANAIKQFYGPSPRESDDYGRIVSHRHYTRLLGLISKDKVYHGGDADYESKYIEPTVLDKVNWEDPIMQDEIFGPILPILTYTDINEVIKVIISRDKPLALYLFTEDKSIEKEVLSRTSFGGGAINDTISHVASPYLPFGGVGASGMGAYHGRYSFDVFSHKRSLIKKSTRIDFKLIYPPYGNKIKLARKFLK